MVEDIVGRQAERLHGQSLFVQMVDITQMDISLERCRPLVVQVEADHVAMILEVELVVVVVALHLGGVDAEGHGNVAVVNLHAQRGLVLRVQIVFGPHILDRSLGMDAGTRLVE